MQYRVILIIKEWVYIVWIIGKISIRGIDVVTWDKDFYALLKE